MREGWDGEMDLGVGLGSTYNRAALCPNGSSQGEGVTKKVAKKGPLSGYSADG